MISDFEPTRLPGGTVWYRDRDHRYFRAIEPVRWGDPEGEWKGVEALTSVTSVIKPFDWFPDGLMEWAARLTREGIAELVEQDRASIALHQHPEFVPGPEWLTDAETMAKRLAEGYLRWQDRRQERATEGTNVHKHALYELARKGVPNYDALTADELPLARGVSAFWIDHDPQTVAEGALAEQVVASREIGVAGRLDYYGAIRRYCPNERCPCRDLALDQRLGSLVLLDAKTGTYRSRKDHVQIPGYDLLMTSSGFGEYTHVARADLPRYWILVPDAFGGYEVIRAHGTIEDFLSAVRLYKRAAEIGAVERRDRGDQDT